MATLSVAFIVKNEAHAGFSALLRACSEFCDEIVVVDTGSTDGTRDLILAETGERHTKLYTYTWHDDFAAARNFAFEQCTSDWILWLDADDVLPETTVAIGKRIKAEILPVCHQSVVRVPYEYSYAEDGTPSLIQNRERFVRRSANFQWVGKIHEVLNAGQEPWVNCPEFVVQHRPTLSHMVRKEGRNLRIYNEQYTVESMSTRDLYLYANELRGAGREAEAIPLLVQYLKAWPEDQFDLFQEPYVARIDLLECLRCTGDNVGALRMAGQAIAYDGARAEAYGLAAMVYYAMKYYAAAFPLFLAAAACKPPTHGGVVYMAFYSKAIREMVEDCKSRLESPGGPGQT